MTTAARPMTAEEFLAVSTEGDRMHLVGGVTVVNEATLRHQLLQSELLFEIGRWCREEADRGVVVGPVDVVVGEHDVYGPDLVYLRDPVADPDARLDRLPDLCVEIRSPGTWRFDVGRKKAMYEAAGLPELWLVDDAAESVLVFRRSSPQAAVFDVALEVAGDDTLASPLLPGFALPVRRLFAAAGR